MRPSVLQTWKWALLSSLGVVCLACLLFVAIAVAYLRLRPNASLVRPWLGLQHWEIGTSPGGARAELGEWDGRLWLAEPEPGGIALRASSDGKRWAPVGRLAGSAIKAGRLRLVPGKGRLWLFAAGKGGTRFTHSGDGVTWAAWTDTEPLGWSLGRPKTRDGAVWFSAAVGPEGKLALLKSRDGKRWDRVAEIPAPAEPFGAALEFLGDGRVVVTAALGEEGLPLAHPKAGTLIAVASPPYRKWAARVSRATRLDAPCLFPVDGQVFAAGRRLTSDRPGATAATHRWLSRTRTSLFRVDPDGLLYLSDLPSAGYTGCAGVATIGTVGWLAYETNGIGRDVPLAWGRVMNREIRLARFSLSSLSQAARPSVSARGIASEKKARPPERSPSGEPAVEPAPSDALPVPVTETAPGAQPDPGEIPSDGPATPSSHPASDP